MTVIEAASKMQATVEAAKERLEGNGFVMSVETDYMNTMLKTVDDIKKAKYVTVSLVVGAEGCNPGDEYCMSLGAQITRGGISEEQLEQDIANYGKMVDEALEVLAGYENKNEGLEYLTAKANEEYEKLLVKIKEEQEKSRRISRIINTVFIIGIAILFIVALLKK